MRRVLQAVLLFIVTTLQANAQLPESRALETQARGFWADPATGLTWDQRNVNAVGGLDMLFTDNTGIGTYADEAGVGIEQMGPSGGAWVHRVFDLGAYFAGKTINGYFLATNNATGSGSYDQYYQDISIVGADGTVTPGFTGQQTVAGGGYWDGCGIYNGSFATEQVPASVTSTQGVRYFAADQVGTAQMEFSGTGTPVWRGEFAPGAPCLASGTWDSATTRCWRRRPDGCVDGLCVREREAGCSGGGASSVAARARGADARRGERGVRAELPAGCGQLRCVHGAGSLCLSLWAFCEVDLFNAPYEDLRAHIPVVVRECLRYWPVGWVCDAA